MRRAVIGGLVGSVGFGASLLGQEVMTAAPDWLWGAIAAATAVGGCLIALLSDVIHGRVLRLERKGRMLTLGLVFMVCGAAGALAFQGLIWLRQDDTAATNTAAGKSYPPLGAHYIRPAALNLVHELRLVAGREFRNEAERMLINGEQLSYDHQFQTLFALTPNAGFSIVPSLRPVTDAMARLESTLVQPSDIGSSVREDGSVSGLEVIRGYEAVYREYSNLLGQPWVLNAHKYTNGAIVDPDTRWHIVLYGLRPVSEAALGVLERAVDDADAQFVMQ